MKDYDTDRSHTYVDWMLDSFAINSALSDAGDAQERIEVEPVPSARDFLAPAIQAMREGNVVSFSYSGFNRSRTEHNIILRPYFLKRYKQRWYMVGISEKKQDIRTYALDRMSNLQLLERKFEMPQDLSADEIFGEIVGITSSKGKTRQIRLQTTTTQAKYLRALPLHPSQREELHDQYSIFTYNLKINWELCHEILGMGAEVKVLEPPELKAMVVEDLKRCLGQYQNID